jgi:hypothetical protein
VGRHRNSYDSHPCEFSWARRGFTPQAALRAPPPESTLTICDRGFFVDTERRGPTQILSSWLPPSEP